MRTPTERLEERLEAFDLAAEQSDTLTIHGDYRTDMKALQLMLEEIHAALVGIQDK